jgi:hypothetical protein
MVLRFWASICTFLYNFIFTLVGMLCVKAQVSELIVELEELMITGIFASLLVEFSYNGNKCRLHD